MRNAGWSSSSLDCTKNDLWTRAFLVGITIDRDSSWDKLSLTKPILTTNIELNDDARKATTTTDDGTPKKEVQWNWKWFSGDSPRMCTVVVIVAFRHQILRRNCVLSQLFHELILDWSRSGLNIINYLICTVKWYFALLGNKRNITKDATLPPIHILINKSFCHCLQRSLKVPWRRYYCAGHAQISDGPLMSEYMTQWSFDRSGSFE